MSGQAVPALPEVQTTTLPMVKSLKPIDMEMIDPATMPTILGKMRGGR
jgi:hypothetical protein